MNRFFILSVKILSIFIIAIFYSHKVYADETETILKQLQILQEDIKTLEKAVYSKDVSTASNTSMSIDNSDVLTKHLLKLSELEEQFKTLTNSFEEVNFKLDKLSNRITKVQTDNQMRFQDLESSTVTNIKKKKKKLPGSGEAQDLGKALEIKEEESDTASAEQIQQTQSVESVGTVVTETAERTEKILPDSSPEKQYEFAVSFIKVGDYETAELALREFVDTHPEHKLAGNAQYWYGETFRVRQLYQDAATAYLNGYQKYPKSSKAPVNLLKLGVMLVQIGEKEQGCSMILGVKDQYPKAKQSVIQKAQYEKKKFNCEKKS
ncbi:tol-pal system protein YbgF [Pelagibacteraceae bacterium]|nr:tol-pal system protein YbgF [Pelagibacteraceae bacterium]